MTFNLISVGLGAIAIVIAYGANRTSRQSSAAAAKSADEARRSADAAEEANAIAKQARAQALELSDVEWQLERAGDYVYLRNVGTTTAYSVAALVRINDERIDVEDAGNIDSDSAVTVDGGQVFNSARVEHNILVESMQGSGILYAGAPRGDIAARISWETANGVPHIQTIDMR